MARPLRIEYPGAFYHVTARGNEQKDLYRSVGDREKFLAYLEQAAERYGALFHGYCLMGNHYHLMVETPQGNLSRIMRHINGAYTTYFNVKRSRAGHLFQGRYKALVVEVDNYATELSRYIHLNPVKAGLVKRPEDYPWSSYRAYLTGEHPQWLRTDLILSYFGDSRDDYAAYVLEKLEGELPDPRIGAVGSAILGDAAFVREIRSRHLDGLDDREIPALKEFSERPDLDSLDGLAQKHFGPGRNGRAAALYLCHRFSGARLQEIGDRYGLTPSAVTQASRRFSARLEEDEGLARKLGQALEELRR
jgi:REP element-mobilizing transposase RayT